MKKYYFLLFGLLCFSVNPLKAQEKVLLNFNKANGAFPQFNSLTLFGNMLYGMTFQGGLHDSGCIFSIDTNGNGYKDLLDFNGTNGIWPDGSLKFSGNIMYGMAEQGGAYGYGCIFSIHTDGSGYSKIFDFNKTDGAYPIGDITLSGNMMYGMTSGGGANGGGCIFSVDTNGNGYQDLYDFYFLSGGQPEGDLTLSGNILYGMTYWGGGSADAGTIFSIQTNGNAFQVLHTFGGIDGGWPPGSLILSGNLTITFMRAVCLIPPTVVPVARLSN